MPTPLVGMGFSFPRFEAAPEPRANAGGRGRTCIAEGRGNLRPSCVIPPHIVPALRSLRHAFGQTIRPSAGIVVVGKRSSQVVVGTAVWGSADPAAAQIRDARRRESNPSRSTRAHRLTTNSPERPANVDMVASMEAHYTSAILAHDALVQGNLDGFRTRMAELDSHGPNHHVLLELEATLRGSGSDARKATSPPPCS